MLFTLFLVCVLELGLATFLLLFFGSRLRFSSPVVGILLALALTYGAGRLASLIWGVAGGSLVGAEIFELLVATAVVATRRVWNAIGQVFFASYVTAALSYLIFAAGVTFDDGLSAVASAASAVLLLLELSALSLSASFAFETCDVICRTRPSREFPLRDDSYEPFVSLHIPAYNEPPEMLIATAEAVAAMDYPRFEVVVIDNNTKDEAAWRPVEEHFREHERVRFVHVDGLSGYKSGALNLALQEYTSPEAELIGVIDADYLVTPNYLRETVGYFSNRSLAFLQTPQDYREWEGSTYFTALYDAYRYFFSMAMPSRNERDSAIFAGTMGILRRSALQQLGGWDEWCITEDAETSLRMLRAGYTGLFLPSSYGKGVMPLTFSSLKSQRYRWCFGGMQILRKHWRSLMPWDKSTDNLLSVAQRLDYLVGGLQWLNDLVYFAFTIVLLIVGGLLLTGDHVPIRPFIGPTVLLPVTLLATGLIRAVWALRRRDGLSVKRALLAFFSWLSLSLTVARACMSGLLKSEGAFLRTPKTGGVHRLRAAIVAALPESTLGIVLIGLAVGLASRTATSLLVIALVLWQALVYVSSPLMSRLNQLAHLTPELERRRRSEERRERFERFARRAQVGSIVAGVTGSVVFVSLMALGASHPGHPSNPLRLQQNGTQAPPSTAQHHGGGHGTGKKGTSTSTSSTASTSSTSTSSTSTSSTSTTTSSTTSTTSTTTTTTSPTTTTTTAAPG